MAVYVVTGKLGGGKTLMSVSRIREYLLAGRKVATNLDIYPEKMLGKYMKNTKLFRLPDIPDIQSLKALPLGYEGDKIDESRNGLLVLDECGIFLNSRNWKDPERAPVNAFFKLLRKLRWDAILIIQDIENLDSDARRTIAEHVVYCKRTDRMNVPLIGPLVKLAWGDRLPLPKIHVGTVRYGTQANAAKVDTWVCRGTGIFDCYETEQLIAETGDFNDYYGLTTMLPSWYTHGRYTNKWSDFKDAVKNLKVKSWHFFCVGALMAATAVNALVTFEPELPKKGMFTCNEVYKSLYGSCDADPIAPYEYYYPKPEKEKKENTEETGLPSYGNLFASKQQQKVKDDTIYIAGWHLTTKGIQMNFADSQGDTYYPMSYKVRKLGDCVAEVEIEGKRQRITCMPDEMANPNLIDNTTSG